MNFEGSMSVTTFLMIDNLEQLCIKHSILKILLQDIQQIREIKTTSIIDTFQLHLRLVKNEINSTEDKIEDDMNFVDFDDFIDNFYKYPVDIFKDYYLKSKLHKYSKLSTDSLRKKHTKYYDRLMRLLIENNDYISSDTIDLLLKIKKIILAIDKIIDNRV
jgi:hypothetical protein